MPTQPLLSYLDGPEGLASTVGAQIENVDSSIKGTNTVLHMKHQDKYLMLTEGCMSMDCMFCDQTFKQHEELGKHVLNQHRPTLCEPAVLCVEAEYLSPLDKIQMRSDSPAMEEGLSNEELLNCKVCGQTLSETLALEAHMKKHKDSFTYRCDICGRRFKEPWFLKNHRRTHVSKSGAKHKSQQGFESPITINEVIQEHAAVNVTTPYKMCMVCGFIFPNKFSLMEHSKIHTKGAVSTEDKTNNIDEGIEVNTLAHKEDFFNSLNLRPRTLENSNKSGKWIGELDPFNTYQAWQLATKGKVAVAHGQVKEPGQDGSTDNDDSGSDKEELSEIWIEENGCQVLHLEPAGKVKSNKNSNYTGINTFEEKEKIKLTSGDVPSVEEDQKILQSTDKPTHCLDCGKAFRTYHQLVLHSRVHKKDRRNDSEFANTAELKPSSASSPDTTLFENQSIVDKAEDGSEDGSEDGLRIFSDKSEDGSEKGKMRNLGCSKECSYCGKSFRSNYYLNIHLRTHTGEKPYKCEFCEYAAAQKTSLRYHLDRHHKDKHTNAVREVVKFENKDLVLIRDSEDLSPEGNENVEISKTSPGLLYGAKQVDNSSAKRPNEAFPVRCSLQVAVNPTEKKEAWIANKHSNQNNENASIFSQVEPKVEGVENIPTSAIKHGVCIETRISEDDQKQIILRAQNTADAILNLVNSKQRANACTQEVPLNLCIRTGEEGSAVTVTRAHLAISTCPFCTYKTFYPEVLMMHQKLLHKYNPCQASKNSLKNRSGVTKIRRTGCPPSLLGKDVSPLGSDVKTKGSIPAHAKSHSIERAKQFKSLESNIPSVRGQDFNIYSDFSNSKSSRLQRNNTSQMPIYHQAELTQRGSGPQIMDKMNRPDVKSLNIPSSNVYSKMNGHFEYQFENGPAWFGDEGREYLYDKAVDKSNFEFGEPSSKRVKSSFASHESCSSDFGAFRRGVDVGRMHPPPSVLQRESLPSKNASILTSKSGLLNTSSVDPRWDMFIKSFDSRSHGPLYSSYSTSRSPIYSTAMEGKMTNAYQLLPHGVLQQRNFEGLVSKAHYGTNDKNM